MAAALGFLVWLNQARIRRVERVSAFGLTAEELPAVAGRPAGRLIIPEHNDESYQWLLETQQMFARHEWRVRHVDYENTPFGHVVHSTSPYRWWLGLVAWCDHRFTGRPLDRAVERAALIADPVLQGLTVLGVALLAAWCFGGWAPAVAALLLVTAFPLAADFLGGAPDNRSLITALLLFALLLLAAGTIASVQPQRSSRRWFFAAGVVAGVALWVSVTATVPLLVGIACGGIAVAWVTRPREGAPGPIGPGLAEWRCWAVGGALTTGLAYLAEFAPAHLATWELRAVHPVYGIAWLGLAELVGRASVAIRTRRLRWNPRGAMVVVVALAALSIPAIAMVKTHSRGFLLTELSNFQLLKSGGSAGALSLWAWLVQHDAGVSGIAMLVTLVILVSAAWVLASKSTTTAARAATALVIGPALFAVGYACWQLSWWGRLEAILVVLAVVVAGTAWGTLPRIARWTFGAILAASVVAGAFQLPSTAGGGADTALSEQDIFGLIERDLAAYLAQRAGPKTPVALAPPGQTHPLYYYAGVRGLGTLAWENQDGLVAAVRILSAWTPEEAKELINGRGVTHLVLPSWDAYLDQFARMGMGQLENTFLERLRYWRLPPWLRPVPYRMPVIPGFEGRTILVLEVVEDQDDASAASRTAECFLELGQVDAAVNLIPSLRRFPADLGAVVARALVELARDNEAEFKRIVDQIRQRLTMRGDRNLPWDRRVSLAVVLMRGKHPDLAKEQVRRCLAEIDEPRLRFLTTESVYRLQVLAKAFDQEIADPRLRQLARDLLPPEMRARVER